MRAVFLSSVILMMTQSYRSNYHTGKVKPRFCCHDTSLSAFKFPWERSEERSDAAFEKIFLALKDIRAMQTKMDTDLQTTKSNFMNILAGITIAIAVIGGTKTLFESIEYIPTIPMKFAEEVIQRYEAYIGRFV